MHITLKCPYIPIQRTCQRFTLPPTFSSIPVAHARLLTSMITLTTQTLTLVYIIRIFRLKPGKGSNCLYAIHCMHRHNDTDHWTGTLVRHWFITEQYDLHVECSTYFRKKNNKKAKQNFAANRLCTMCVYSEDILDYTAIWLQKAYIYIYILRS